MTTTKITMEAIVNLAKSRGFVYAGSEIYGGLANSWDYGPYGSIMKENIKFLWQKQFVQKREDMMMLDSAILMNPQVWVASGHVGGFSDPLIDCKSCNMRHRADKLLEWDEKLNPKWLEVNTFKSEYAKTSNNKNIESMNSNEFLEYILATYIPCPNPKCWKKEWGKIQNFNLMFKTHQWVTEDSATVVYMRPETAQWIFVNFQNIARTSRKKVPFGVAQVGKAFRNEITPGNFIFRTREFEQMEIEYFCEPEQIAPGKHLEVHSEWKYACFNFLTDVIGIKAEGLRMRDHAADELSHYSAATTDIEYQFPFGWGELWGIADRTDFDLKAHMSVSKQDLSYFDPINNRKYIPYVIEPSVWLTRLFLATLIDAYTEEPGGEEWEVRKVLKLDPRVAPVKVWVLPIVKKIWDDARKVFAQLTEDFICEYDESGTVGKRYARFDEIGTPFCVTIDSENFAAWNVTVRYRDSMQQELVAISELNQFIHNKMR
jgi:glycyl-tRNA synthetase